LRWWIPGVIVVLLLGATSFLLTLSDSQERAQAQDVLVSDSLWVRQSLQFQLEREAEALDLIAADLARGTLGRGALEARLRVFHAPRPRIAGGGADEPGPRGSR